MTYDAERRSIYFGLKSVGFWSRWILYLTPAMRRPQYSPILPRPSSLPPFDPLSSMSQLGRNNEPAFGYISAVETAEYGYFGGYLIVSPLGRPLEFHCSAPVRPNRAQQILYGATLESYLLGEQIGGTLLKAAKITPNVVFTDSEALLHARDVISRPMALVLPADSPGSRLTNSQIPFAAFKLHLPIGYEQDETTIAESLAFFTRRVDLAEPFGRIHDAILEAQRIGSGGTEGHEQAA